MTCRRGGGASEFLSEILRAEQRGANGLSWRYNDPGSPSRGPFPAQVFPLGYQKLLIFKPAGLRKKEKNPLYF